MSKLDYQQVIKSVFNEGSNSLRVSQSNLLDLSVLLYNAMVDNDNIVPIREDLAIGVSITNSDNTVILNSGVPTTVYLPIGTNGKKFLLKCVNGTTATIVPDGLDTIDNSILMVNDSTIVIFNNGNWYNF